MRYSRQCWPQVRAWYALVNLACLTWIIVFVAWYAREQSKLDRLLLILSEASMKSVWVRTEIANARRREVKQRRKVLFPISLVAFSKIRRWKLPDADTGTDSAREIREYFIPDFSNWKDHDAYKLAFDRLLKDLQGKTEPPPV